MPTKAWRSQCLVQFEIVLPGVLSVLTEGCSYNHIVDNGRGVSFPQKLLTTVRWQKAEQKAAEATHSIGCPCKLLGYDGKEEGLEFQSETNMIFAWSHVRTAAGEPYTVRITYHNLVAQARPVPNCPLRLLGRPGLLYSLEFYNEFAENVVPGLEYRGLVYEGAALTLERSLPAGGVDVLDEAVYWLFPSGALLCRSPRDLQRAGPAAGNTPDSKDDYEAVGAALGYQFLGGRCDTTELLQDPGIVAERRWTQLSWSLPESTLAACWWLTNAPPEDPKAAPDRDLSARPKLLCRSLGVLRVELHQNRVATIAKVRSERQRRRKQNAATELLLKQNPFWKRFATAEQRAAMGSLSATSLAALISWASTTEAACRAEAAAEQEELCRIHQELLGLVRRLAGEQKHDVHSERFPLTPDGLFAQIWEAVLVRDDLDQVLRASRAMRLEGVAQAAHDLAAGGEDTEEDDEDASHGQRPTERPEPDHFTQPLRRLPKGNLVAMAHAKEVLLD